jgi:hypothetical protein
MLYMEGEIVITKALFEPPGGANHIAGTGINQRVILK